MKKLYIPATFSVLFLLASCGAVAMPELFLKNQPTGNVLFFNPEIFPDIPEVYEPTNTAFYAAVSEKENQLRNLRMMRVDVRMPFDSAQAGEIREFCVNNNAEMAILPKVKYFKVGFGKYIFSNQVVISMKLYDSQGDLLTETSYDTYRKNARLLGSAENSIRIGAAGAIKNLNKFLARSRRSAQVKAG